MLSRARSEPLSVDVVVRPADDSPSTLAYTLTRSSRWFCDRRGKPRNDPGDAYATFPIHGSQRPRPAQDAFADGVQRTQSVPPSTLMIRTTCAEHSVEDHPLTTERPRPADNRS